MVVCGSGNNAGKGSRAGNQVIGITFSTETIFGSGRGDGAIGGSRAGNHPIAIALKVVTVLFEFISGGGSCTGETLVGAGKAGTSAVAGKAVLPITIVS